MNRHNTPLSLGTSPYPSTWLSLVLFALMAVSQLKGAESAPVDGENLSPSRFAFSSSMFVDVNENDAKAAMKVLSQTIASDHGIPVDPTIQLLTGADAIKNALLSKSIDAITMPTPEYWLIRKETPLGNTVFGVKEGKCTEEYLLLVNQNSGIKTLSDLQGKSVVFFKNPRASLAPSWVETLLLQERLGKASTFWRQISFEAKLTRVVLPLYFRQIDACVTTRTGFELMVELNPQVGRQLKVLANSPAVIPVVFGFRGDYVSPYREKLSVVVNKISGTIAGGQVLTLFQSDGLTKRPISELDSAMEMLDLHKQLSDEADRSSRNNALKDTPKEDGK